MEVVTRETMVWEMAVLDSVVDQSETCQHATFLHDSQLKKQILKKSSHISTGRRVTVGPAT